MHHNLTPLYHCQADEIDVRALAPVAVVVAVSASATIASWRRWRCGEKVGLGDNIVDRMRPRGSCKGNALNPTGCSNAHRDGTCHLERVKIYV